MPLCWCIWCSLANTMYIPFVRSGHKRITTDHKYNAHTYKCISFIYKIKLFHNFIRHWKSVGKWFKYNYKTEMPYCTCIEIMATYARAYVCVLVLLSTQRPIQSIKCVQFPLHACVCAWHVVWRWCIYERQFEQYQYLGVCKRASESAFGTKILAPNSL